MNIFVIKTYWMRIFIFFLLLCFTFSAKAQLGYEDYYSEKDLQTQLQQAKTIEDQMNATGRLALHFKKLRNDSTGILYIRKIFGMAEGRKDVKLMANALWWDIAYETIIFEFDYELSLEKATRLLKYADEHDLLKEKISANLFLALTTI